MKYETVIGLEVHAQLKTESKIFCSCSTNFGAEPNSQVCPICLGMPGVLPMLNRKAVDFAIKVGCATHCRIARRSIFARKNYFYPDLPKGYQISQYEAPLCQDGYVEIASDGKRKRIGLHRIHLEEDAGKSVHAEEWIPEQETLVDLNRCGVPLIEIVTRPDLRSPREASIFLAELKQILEYLEVSDCNMEEGSLRCDANISLRPEGSTSFGTKTELKNMNSFRSVERALEFEVERQKALLENEQPVIQETLLWNADENRAIPMRSKEEADDYRYFPEPDLVPLEVDSGWIERIQQEIPELPLEKKSRFISEYHLPPYDAEVLVANRFVADFFEQTQKLHPNPKAVSNFIMGELLRYLSEKKMPLLATKLTPVLMADLLQLIQQGTINLKVAKSIFPEIVETGRPPEQIVKERGLVQVSDENELKQVVQQILKANQAEVEKYLGGKSQLFGFFMGQVMRATRGKGNPQIVNRLLKQELEEMRTSDGSGDGISP